MGCSRREILALFYYSVELPSALVMPEVPGWAVWFVAEGSEVSTLVSAIGAAFQPGFFEGK